MLVARPRDASDGPKFRSTSSRARFRGVEVVGLDEESLVTKSMKAELEPKSNKPESTFTEALSFKVDVSMPESGARLTDEGPGTPSGVNTEDAGNDLLSEDGVGLLLTRRGADTESDGVLTGSGG